MAASGGARGYERYGWIIILVSAILGLFFALALVVAPTDLRHGLARFRAGEVPAVLRGWGITWVFFNVLVLLILFRNFRRGERWAWWVLWLLPPLWLSHFVLNPANVQNLVIAIITAVGLILPYRTFFSASGEQTSRVSCTSEKPLGTEFVDVQQHVRLLAVWLPVVWLLAVGWPKPAPPEMPRGHAHRQRPECHLSQARCRAPKSHLRSRGGLYRWYTEHFHHPCFL